MFDIDSWQEVWVTITRNKRRSLLTAFGVFWGIFMLVVMLASGSGLGNGIMAEVDGVPENSEIFFSDRTSEPYMGFQKGRYWYLKEEDLDIINSQVNGVKYSVPFMSGQQVTVNHGRQSTSCSTVGLDPRYEAIIPQSLSYGRFFNQVDVAQCRKVCVLGRKVYEELFEKGEDPIGQYIKMYNIYFKIVGVTESLAKGVNINGSDETRIALPYTVVQQIYNCGEEVHMIMVVAKEGQRMDPLSAQVKSLIKSRHSISPTDEFALQTVSLEKIFHRFRLLFLGINVLIWIVGMGTLLAGVVGVSNIIMVTVRERTKEIGVRRALGARPVTIVMQIIKESMVLTVLAGFFGLAAGVWVMDFVDKFILSQMTGSLSFQNPQIDFASAVLAAVVILVSGVLAGILPAIRALQIKAIDAIREEN